MVKRYCHACGHVMKTKNIAVDANWGKYTVMVTGMMAYQCQKCSETVVGAEELLALHELEQRFAEFTKTDWDPASKLRGRSNGQPENGSPQQPEAAEQTAYSLSDANDLIGVKEVAEILQIAPQSVYSLIYVDKLPAVKIGHAWKFKREDVQAYMAANAT
mgnify:CR=1 FL=1